MSLIDPEVPVPGKTRCVNDKGEVSYVNDATAQNKHWQRSTGYRPKPLPIVENLPPLTMKEIHKEVAAVNFPDKVKFVPDETKAAEPKPKKQGRPSKTITN